MSRFQETAVSDADFIKSKIEAAPLPEQRILIRMLDRLGGDSLKAFVESRAGDLAIDLCDSDDALRKRLAVGEPRLVIWCQQTVEADPFAGIISVFGSARRTPV